MDDRLFFRVGQASCLSSSVGRASRPSSACKADLFFASGEMTGKMLVLLKNGYTRAKDK
jgi:hypothetical protein